MIPRSVRSPDEWRNGETNDTTNAADAQTENIMLYLTLSDSKGMTKHVNIQTFNHKLTTVVVLKNKKCHIHSVNKSQKITHIYFAYGHPHNKYSSLLLYVRLTCRKELWVMMPFPSDIWRYRISSNRSRVSNTSRVSNRSWGSDFICSNRSRVSNTSRVSNRSRGV